MSNPPPYTSPPPGDNDPPPGGYSAPPPGGGGYGAKPATNGIAIAALIVGVISFLFALIPVIGWASVPFAIGAIAMGIAGMSRAKKVNVGRGMALGGVITGVLALLVSIAYVIIVVVFADDAENKIDDVICQTDESALGAAVEAFRSAEQRDPESEAELVEQGYLPNESDTYDFSISGDEVNVTAQDGGGC